MMEGGDLNVPCDCLGIPEPEVTWFKNTESINNNINEDVSFGLLIVIFSETNFKSESKAPLS